MANLGTSRTVLHSFIYWATFVALACFVTFFLSNMVQLANSEDHQYNTSSQLNVKSMHSAIQKGYPSSSTPEDLPLDESGE